MSRLLKHDTSEGREVCIVPVNVSDLCHEPDCCNDAGSLAGLDFTAWQAYVDSGFDLPAHTVALGAAYTLEELASLNGAQDALAGAWEEMRGRTCYRFHTGECLIVRLCPPFCPPCPPCSSCHEPWRADVSDLLEVVDVGEIVSVRWVMFNGGTIVSDIDRPGELPGPSSLWRLEAGDSRTLDLIPQRLLADDDLPALPDQNMSMAFGRPGTSAMIIRVRDDVPALVARAVADLAKDYLETCHTCRKADDRATAVTNDGTTYALGDPDADRQIKSLLLAEGRYGCKNAARIFSPCDPDGVVQDMRWVCCEDLVAAVPELA